MSSWASLFRKHQLQKTDNELSPTQSGEQVWTPGAEVCSSELLLEKKEWKIHMVDHCVTYE